MVISGEITGKGVDQLGQNLVLARQKGKAFALRRNRSKPPPQQGYFESTDPAMMCRAARRDIGRRIWAIFVGAQKITIVVGGPRDNLRLRRHVSMSSWVKGVRKLESISA
ncbi:hypothetical protein EAS61_14990 [Bradyrhizobium zhanjiangense]|uniref:Uncharacterized protein n=1 Tax=Bradyrhizobium zhanjiangense TaxID=1325107 RepID=A0A4Q0QP21_9BRAD|nr:hypothetical protein EAS62_28900 [Bradyrhizobium zhanjiangense]RXG97307.1 hypothetical protein EAS61_14990 [Bradyrhizobium zhanjiangense]